MPATGAAAATPRAGSRLASCWFDGFGVAMSQLTPLPQNSFAAGEISPQLWGRTDLIKYRTGAAVMRNMFVDFRGGAVSRAGTQIVRPCPDPSLFGSANPPVLIPFIFNVDQAYMLEFDDRGMRVISGGKYVTRPAKTIASISASSPIVIEVPGHDLTVNSRLYIESVRGRYRSNGISGLNG